MVTNCSLKCPTCGYKLEKFVSRCPRCSTYLLEVFKCAGNCSRCSKKENKNTQK